VYPAICEKIHRWLSGLTLLALAGALLLMVKNGVDNALGSQLPGIAFGLSPLIVYTAVANPLLRVILSWKPVQAIGKISISVFFWHMVVYETALQLLGRITGSENLTDLQYLVYLLVMLGVSFLSDRYLEKGFFRKKEPGRQRADKV
jgi:peptidoglycan/LPS O-acetylase OafA/YrhL